VARTKLGEALFHAEIDEKGQRVHYPSMPPRAIIDTNVFLSALWSTRGAAFAVFAELRRSRWQMVLSNHLLL